MHHADQPPEQVKLSEYGEADTHAAHHDTSPCGWITEDKHWPSLEVQTKRKWKQDTDYGKGTMVTRRGDRFAYFILVRIISKLSLQLRDLGLEQTDHFFVVRFHAARLPLRGFGKVNPTAQGSGFLNDRFGFLKVSTWMSLEKKQSHTHMQN